jgi:hypothetical protein
MTERTKEAGVIRKLTSLLAKLAFGAAGALALATALAGVYTEAHRVPDQP